MAFSDGQLQFAFFFAVCFILAMIYAYRSDLKSLNAQKKNAFRVMVFIILVLTLFFFMVKVLAS